MNQTARNALALYPTNNSYDIPVTVRQAVSQHQPHADSMLVDVLRGTGEPIVCMAVAENGVVLVTGGADGRAVVWRTDMADSIKFYCELVGHQTYIRDCLIFYPQVITASGDGTVKKWHLPTKQLVQTWRGHDGPVTTMVLLGGSIFTGSLDESAIMWDYNTGTPISRFRGHLGPVGCFTLVPMDHSAVVGAHLAANGIPPVGNILASGSADATIRLWLTENGQMIKVLGFQQHQDPTGSGYQQHVPDGSNHRGPVTALAFVRSVQLLCSGSTDNTIRGWAAPSFNCVIVLDTHAASISQLQVLNDDLLYSGAADGAVYSWSFEMQFAGHAGEILPVAHVRTSYSPFLERSVHGLMNNYNEPIYGTHHAAPTHSVPVGHPRHPMTYNAVPSGDQAPVETVTCFCKVGRFLCVGSIDGMLRCYDELGGIVRRLSGHTGAITACKNLMDRFLLTASVDGTIRVWNRAVLFSATHRSEPSLAITGMPQLQVEPALPSDYVKLPPVFTKVNAKKQPRRIIVLDGDEDDSGTEDSDLRTIATQTRVAEKKKPPIMKPLKRVPSPKKSEKEPTLPTEYDPTYLAMRHHQRDLSLMSLAAEVAVERALRKMETDNMEMGRSSLPPILPTQQRNTPRAQSLPSATNHRLPSITKPIDDDDEYFQELDYAPSQVVRRK